VLQRVWDRATTMVARISALPLIVAVDTCLLYLISEYIIFSALNRGSTLIEAQIWIVRLQAALALICLYKSAVNDPGYIRKGWVRRNTAPLGRNNIFSFRLNFFFFSQRPENVDKNILHDVMVSVKTHREDYSALHRFCNEVNQNYSCRTPAVF
jgi:hypothetical protein